MAVVAGEKGRAIANGLKQLESDYHAQQAALSETFCAKAVTLAPFLKRSKHTTAYGQKG